MQPYTACSGLWFLADMTWSETLLQGQVKSSKVKVISKLNLQKICNNLQIKALFMCQKYIFRDARLITLSILHVLDFQSLVSWYKWALKCEGKSESKIFYLIIATLYCM